MSFQKQYLSLQAQNNENEVKLDDVASNMKSKEYL
jgi:hypothetical protein